MTRKHVGPIFVLHKLMTTFVDPYHDVQCAEQPSCGWHIRNHPDRPIGHRFEILNRGDKSALHAGGGVNMPGVPKDALGFEPDISGTWSDEVPEV